ncbi:hypothetical protein [Kineosporia sp. R_H_3]|uniref:hypothetical protein n=1 Tax=Kineosporia sp. R_H_3 TaxID=1961848 RepID=UPI00117B4E3D|nr:hypothetical protein [Kineosporia sp. R_H_3]
MSDEDIDWSTVKACCGPATSIPSLLRDLASAQPSQRSHAISELWGCLCHQGTVYEASALAVPFLFTAAKSLELPSAERDQLLALIVHIGLGEDTTWRGYTSWEVVQACAVAVKALLPDLAAWALVGPPEARRWTLALAAQHPNDWASFGIDTNQLMPNADPATAELVRHAVAGTAPGEGVIDAVLASNADLRDYRRYAALPRNRVRSAPSECSSRTSASIGRPEQDRSDSRNDSNDSASEGPRDTTQGNHP